MTGWARALVALGLAGDPPAQAADRGRSFRAGDDRHPDPPLFGAAAAACRADRAAVSAGALPNSGRPLRPN